MSTDYLQAHNFDVVAKLFDDELHAVITFHGKIHDMKTVTSYIIDLSNLTIKRTGFDLIINSQELKDDVECELYDNLISLGIHSSTWEHNLIHYAVTSNHVEDFIDNVLLAFKEECQLSELDMSAFHQKVETISVLKRRMPIFIKSEVKPSLLRSITDKMYQSVTGLLK